MRAHVVIPPDLLEEVDRLVGSRRRSQFFTTAIEEKVQRVKLASAARKAVGSLSDVPIPGWESSVEAAEWVRVSRRTDEQRTRQVVDQ